MTDDLKSMPVFFADNMPLLSENAELVGNLVIGKIENAKFPTAGPVGQAEVAGFDGFIYVVALNQRIIVHIFDGKTKADVGEIASLMKSTKPKDWPDWIHQYQIDVMGLVQASVLHHTGSLGGGAPDVFKLLDQIGQHHPPHSKVLKTALERFMMKPDIPGMDSRDAYAIADHMLASVEQS